MNDDESKVPIYIAILVALLIVAAGGYYLTSGISTGGPSKEVPPETTAATTTTTAATAATTAATTTTTAATTAPAVAEKKVETIKCELCHTDSKDIKQHVNGGKLCMNCHGSQVHRIHIGEGTVGLDCKACHGFPPKIPTVKKGEGPGSYSVCEQCHAAPPNSLKPSNGNLIVVHLSRGTYCTNCHGTDISRIHKAALEKLKNQSK